MRFGPRIEQISSPTTGGCATSYATDAGFKINPNNIDAYFPQRYEAASTYLVVYQIGLLPLSLISLPHPRKIDK